MVIPTLLGLLERAGLSHWASGFVLQRLGVTVVSVYRQLY